MVKQYEEPAVGKYIQKVIAKQISYTPTDKVRSYYKSLSLFLDQKELHRQRMNQGFGSTVLGRQRGKCVSNYLQAKLIESPMEELKYCRECNQLRNDLSGNCFFCDQCKAEVEIALKSVFAANKFCSQNYLSLQQQSRLSKEEFFQAIIRHQNFPFKAQFQEVSLNQYKLAYLQLTRQFLRLYINEPGTAQLMQTLLRKLYVSRKQNVRTFLKFMIHADECNWQKIRNIKFMFCKRFDKKEQKFELQIDDSGELQPKLEHRSDEVLRQVCRILCMRLKKNWKGLPMIRTQRS